MAAAPAPDSHWRTGLFHCLDNLDNLQTCIVTCFCPCITFGQIAEIVDDGSRSCGRNCAVYTLMAFSGFACLYSGQYRFRLRTKYHLEEAPCNDCIVHFFCSVCALCQERRELKLRGIVVERGRRGNANQNRGVTEPPAVEISMAR